MTLHGDFKCDRQEDSSDATWNSQQSLPLYEGSSLTYDSSSILLMIMKYAMKHNITEDALADLLELVRYIVPSPILVHLHYITLTNNLKI